MRAPDVSIALSLGEGEESVGQRVRTAGSPPGACFLAFSFLFLFFFKILFTYLRECEHAGVGVGEEEGQRQREKQAPR